MKAKLLFLFTLLALLGGIDQAAAQDARFFRIVGPAATTITASHADGLLVWSNALAGTNYTVQTATSLADGANWVDYVQLPVTNRVNTNRIIDLTPPAGMVLIPAGSFTMGDTFNEGNAGELPLHTVYVSAIYMDRYEVTYALWQSVYHWATNHGYSFYYAGLGKGTNHPVQTIEWYDAVMWCNARSELEGRIPAYYTSAAQTTVYRTGEVDVDNNSVKWNSGYRLPTEAEWEKAARGGLSGLRFPWGNTISESQANYYSTGNTYDLSNTGYNPTFYDGVYPTTSPVNSFAPNGYGVYDLAGNVSQWCWDWYGDYSSGAQTDPRGPTSGPYVGSDRVLRGGNFGTGPSVSRAASRRHYYQGVSGAALGFRSVLAAGQ